MRAAASAALSYRGKIWQGSPALSQIGVRPIIGGGIRPAGRERNFRLNSVNFVNLAAKEGLGRVNSPDNAACPAPRAEKFVPPLFQWNKEDTQTPRLTFRGTAN